MKAADRVTKAVSKVFIVFLSAKANLPLQAI